jgi:hypothetical protein
MRAPLRVIAIFVAGILGLAACGGEAAPTEPGRTVAPPASLAPASVTLLSATPTLATLSPDPSLATASAAPEPTATATPVPTATARTTPTPGSVVVRIAYLHHSTGENVWNGGVGEFIAAYNRAHGTRYEIDEITYPDTGGGYPWENYPYDYWNLWVNHTGRDQDRGELTLDQLAASYDVIVFKHCFPVSDIGPDSDSDPPSVSSSAKTLANYRLQYAALRTRMRQFPDREFIVWTGAALTKAATSPDRASRARTFFGWVRDTWDQPADNIFVWDFYALETEGGLYLAPSFASSPDDPHPNADLSAAVAPLIGQRIVDVIEGRGDAAGVTGR